MQPRIPRDRRRYARAARVTLGLFTLVVSSASDLAAQGELPYTVEREARQAVEAGTERSAQARWATRLRQNANDVAAQLGLATLSDLGYDFPAATTRYRALSDTTSRRPDRWTAFARMAWARMDELRGAMSDADAGFAQARVLARRAGDRQTEAIVAASQSFLRANAQSMEAGIATLDTAFRLLPPEAGDDIRSDFARRRATLLAVQLAPSARATAEEAIRLARRAGDRRAEANAMRALALHHRMRSFPDSARAALDTTARLQRAARDRRGLAETLVRIANEYLGERRLGAARTALMEARVEALASHNDYALAATETGLGALALRVHDVASASEHLRRAESLNVAAHDTASLVEVLNYRVNALLDGGMLDSAWVLQRAVLGHFERSQEIPDVVVAHRVLANIALAQRRYDAAARELDTAEALVTRHKLLAARPPLWFDRARLAHRLGRDAEATALLTRYIPSLHSEDGVARWDADVHLAEIEARSGRAEAAARRLAGASDALDAWRASLSDSTLRLLAFQASTHEEGERDAHFAAAIAALAEHGQVAAAFEQAERRRARTLAERIVQAEALRAGTGATSNTRRTTDRITLAGVTAALPDDRTALLEFVTGGADAPTTLVIVSRWGTRAVRLASVDSLLPSIRRLLAAIESGEEAGPLAQRLGDVLLGPALRDLEGRIDRLVIVPDGALHRVPFDLLRLADRRAAIERFETSLVPSAAVAMLLWRRPPSTRGESGRVLAFGDPAFGREAAVSVRGIPVTRGTGDSAEFARLPESGREARIAASFGDRSVVLLRDDATALRLVQAPPDSFSVLHLATHAVVDERSLARSAVVLAPTAGHSGLMMPGELATLRLGADLVVLSACRSAGGVVVNGEGVQGLTAPLLAAGARAVVASGWAVDDRETVAVIEDLYRGLARGEPVGTALRSAKLAALRRGALPRDWASFAVIGDPLVRVPLRSPRRVPWMPIAVTATGLVAMLAVRRRRAVSNSI
jgi:CHAT domain-containing protein